MKKHWQKIKMKEINLRLIILLFFAFFLLSWKLDKPFIGHHDWNGVFFGNIIRNTKEFGFLKTKLGAVYTFLPKNETEFKFYTHYPPLFHLILGLSAKIFGVAESSMRFTAISFSLLALFVFFKLSERLMGQNFAFISSLFFILNPMFLYFGKMPIHEVFGLSLIILAFYNYYLFFQKQSRKRLFNLGFFLFLACQTVWSAYYLAPLFIFHYWLAKKGKAWFLKISSLMLIPVLCFLSHLGHSYFLTGRWDIDLFKTMLFRMQIGEKAEQFSFSLWGYFKQEALWLTVYYTRILVFLAGIYTLYLLRKILVKKTNKRDLFLIIILIFPFIDVLIFRNVCYIHDYKLYYFLISLPLLAALSLFWLKEKMDFLGRKKRFISLLLISLILILFAGERKEYTRTLLNSAVNKPAYELGRIINQRTKREEAVLLGSPSFAEFSDLFLNFYAERRIIYFSPRLEDFLALQSPEVRFLVLIKNRETAEPALLEKLETEEVPLETGDYLFFDLENR